MKILHLTKRNNSPPDILLWLENKQAALKLNIEEALQLGKMLMDIAMTDNIEELTIKLGNKKEIK